MCLIIANPKGVFVPTDYVVNAYSQNSDGFGLMYSKDGQLRVKRGLFTIGNIMGMFDDLHKAEIPYVAHFRYATHGTTNAQNCHPFPVTTSQGGIAMVHNGTLTGSEWRSATKSDTNLLVGRIQRHLDNKDFRAKALFEKDAPEIASRYGSSIGTDKLVFMNGRNEINIYNEDNGLWMDDVWYSNLYSLCSPQVRYGTWRGRKGWETVTTKSVNPTRDVKPVVAKHAAE